MGTGEADDVVSGRSHDRQWAVLMSASGQLYGRLRAVSRGRRHSTGVGIELLGLFLTGSGLMMTWRDHAAGDKFLPELGRELRELIRRLLRRPRHISVNLGSVAGTLDLAGSAHATVGFPPGATPDEKISMLKKQLDRIGADVSRALGQNDQLEKRLNRHVQQVAEQFSSLRQEVSTRLREQQLNGLPLAVFGLALAVVGTALQLASAFL